MALRDELSSAMKDAMKAKDSRKLSTIRLILAAVKDKDIDNRTSENAADDDAMITGILSKMVKQRRDSIQAYEEAGRCELAEQERDEIDVIESFLPRQMDEDEIRTAVKDTIKDVGAQGLKDMGLVMGALKSKYDGQMDFGKASAAVKTALA